MDPQSADWHRPREGPMSLSARRRRGARMDGRANPGERSINIVIDNKPKVLEGLSQKGTVAGTRQTPPRPPLRQCIIKPTGYARGKSVLGSARFFPYARPHVLHRVVLCITKGNLCRPKHRMSRASSASAYPPPLSSALTAY